MHKTNRFMSGSLGNILLSAAAIALPAGVALGDTIYIQSTANGTPLARPNVVVNKIAKDKDDDFESLYFTTDGGGGRTEHRDLNKVSRIEADGETVFNQAEDEYAKGNLDAAGQDYKRAMSSSNKEWLKHRADVRLLGISSKTGDFIGAVSGYVEMVRKDPTAAAQHKPAVASAKPAQLGAAIAAVNKGLTGASADTKATLYPFLIELYNKNGDTAGATAVLAELKKLHPAGTPTNTGGPATPDADNGANAMLAKQAEADTALTKANGLFAAKDYDNAIASINAASASFVDPERQAKALYLIAEAKAATATTPEALQEAALAYMRVVAHFKAQPGGPAADALYKTAAIEEKLAKPREALVTYQQVVNEYAGTKAAEEAKAAVARLSGGK